MDAALRSRRHALQHATPEHKQHPGNLIDASIKADTIGRR
jgi:hypothetical protein